MAKIAKHDMELVSDGRLFLTHLIMEKGMKHTSISRAIGNSNTSKVRDGHIGPKAFIRMFKHYHNNYFEWCKDNSKTPDERVTTYINELYG